MAGTPTIPIPIGVRTTLMIIYCVLLVALFVLWVLFAIFQDKWNIPEKRIEQVGTWFNSLLMMLVGYLAGVLTG